MAIQSFIKPDQNDPPRYCCGNRTFWVKDCPVVVRNIGGGDIPLLVFPDNNTDNTPVATDIVVAEGTTVVFEPGRYTLDFDCAALEGTDVDLAAPITITCEKAPQIDAQFAALLAAITSGNADTAECLDQLKVLVAANNDAVALAEILTKLKAFCDKQEKLLDANSEQLNAIKALCDKMLESIAATDAVVAQLQAGSKEQIACLKEMKTALDTLIKAAGTAATASAATAAAVALTTAAVKELKECNTKENKVQADLLQKILDKPTCQMITLYKIDKTPGAIEQQWIQSAIVSSTAAGSEFTDSFSGTDNEGLPAHPNAPDVTQTVINSSTTNVGPSDENPSDQAQLDMWLCALEGAQLFEHLTTAEAVGIYFSDGCDGVLKQVLNAPYLNQGVNPLGFKQGIFRVRMYHDDATASGVARLQYINDAGVMTFVPREWMSTTKPVVTEICAWICDDGTLWNEDRSQQLTLSDTLVKKNPCASGPGIWGGC